MVFEILNLKKKNIYIYIFFRENDFLIFLVIEKIDLNFFEAKEKDF